MEKEREREGEWGGDRDRMIITNTCMIIRDGGVESIICYRTI